MRRLATPVLIGAATLGLVTACSGSDSGSATSTQPPASSSSVASSTSQGAPSSSASSSSAPSSADAAGSDVVSNPPAKSWNDALTAARKEFSGDVAKIELETKEGGGMEYKIELLSATTKYSVQYDASDLKKVSDKRDDLGDDAAEKRKKTFKTADLIDLEKAAGTARKQQDGSITKWKVEGKDSGLVQYEFDIRPAGASDDKEIQVNAKDGSIVKDD